MVGRPLPDEAVMRAMGYGRPELVRRREVLRETLAAFERAEPRERYHRLAEENLTRWRREARAASGPSRRGPPPTFAPSRRGQPPTSGPHVRVIAGDWGEVTAELTREHGVCFAVLNMANAFVPGGAYVEGTAAQEENMFRRTDAHFHITDDLYDVSVDRYRPHLTALLSARDGRVFLDTTRPRVCIRGAEDRGRADLGYRWLADDEIFPFYELRAAAQDLRGGRAFDEAEARRRVAAQLDTMVEAGVRHAVLSAFGCGAFENPAARIATIYRDELDARRDAFDLVAFAIFAPGYGPDNHRPFAEVFRDRADT